MFLVRPQQGHSMWLVQHCARDILEALSFLHREGYVHADLKPRNILWSADDECFKLIDFGLSFKQGNQVGVGQTGAILTVSLDLFQFSVLSLGCQVHPDRWVPCSRSRAPEQPGPGWGGGRLWLHSCCGPLESGGGLVGDVLRNQTERHCLFGGVEGMTVVSPTEPVSVIDLKRLRSVYWCLVRLKLGNVPYFWSSVPMQENSAAIVDHIFSNNNLLCPAIPVYHLRDLIKR